MFLTTPLSRAEQQLTEIAAPWIRVGFFGAFLAWSPDSKWIVTADKTSPKFLLDSSGFLWTRVKSGP